MLKGKPLYLALSVAANAVLIGIVVGRLVGGGQPSAMEMEFERYGPTSDVVAAAWEQLPERDRDDLSKQLRDEWRAMEPERQRLQDAGRAVYEAALKEPFDEQELRDAVVVFQHKEQRLQRRAEDILIRHLEGMPAEARATAAVGLLTPYNARVQRANPKPLIATGKETEVGARDASATRDGDSPTN